MLATDLDGTLIPLNGNEKNKTDLQVLSQWIEQQSVTLVFVTGRHFDSVESAIAQFNLPRPSWIICDVGGSIYELKPDGRFESCDAYRLRLKEIKSYQTAESMISKLEGIPALRLQEQEKQSEFKLSYYADGQDVDDIASLIATELYSCGISVELISSVDPFNGDGLIDLMPTGVSKGFALDWLISHCSYCRESVVFSGDSGNDYSAMTAGYQTIVVNNADRALVQQVQEQHQKSGWINRLYHSKSKATSGVLEGCLNFELLCDDHKDWI